MSDVIQAVIVATFVICGIGLITTIAGIGLAFLIGTLTEKH